VTRRTASAAALAVVLMLATVPGASPSAAQTDLPVDPASDAVARVTLTAIDPVIGRGSIPPAPDDEDEAPSSGLVDPAAVTGVNWSVLIEHTGPDPWGRVEVVAELHGALGSRSALRAALAGGSVPPTVQRVSVSGPPGPLVPGGVMRITGVVPLAGAALTGTDSGVHPLRLQVLADGQPVARIDTAVVRLGSVPTARLATTLVWQLSSAPLRDPSGDPAAALDPLTGDGGRFSTLLGALSPLVERDGATSPLRDLTRGVALVAPAHLLEDLERRAAVLPAAILDDDLTGVPTTPESGPDVDEAALRAAALLRRIRSTALALPSGPIVSAYGDADLSRLLVSGAALQPIAARSVLEGERRTLALLGRPSAAGVLLEAPVAPRTLDLLPNSTVLIPYAAIDAPDLALDVPLDDPVRTLRSPTGQTITAIVADPYLSVALGASTREVPSDPLLAAHEVLVRTAMVYFEAPGRQGRGLLLLPPPGFDPDPRFAAEVLGRLARAPWLAPSTPGEVVSAARESREPARLATRAPEPLPSRLVDALTTTARDLEILVGAADTSADPAPGTAPDIAPDTTTESAPDTPGPDPIIPVGDRSLAEAGDELMRATSTAFATDLDAALALLDGVRAGVDAAFGQVRIALTDVTLTDRDGTVPLTLVHTGGVPIRVRVEVSAPAALTWSDGRVREVTLAVDAERSLEFPVRSGATGRFPVSIRVTDPTGARLLAEDTIGVRATAVAGPALAFIILAITVLTVLGTVRQRRRGVAWRTTEPRDGRTARDGRTVGR